MGSSLNRRHGGPRHLTSVVILAISVTAPGPWTLAQADDSPAVDDLGEPTIAKKERLKPNRLEVGGAPVIMADTDLGFGVGGMASLARFGRGCSPFRWQLMVLAFVTMKSTDDGLETVFHDDFVKLDLPGLLGGRLRLTMSLGFSRHSNTGYYGIGNAATSPRETDPRRYQYDRIYPQALARARLKLGERLALMAGGSFTYNWIHLYEGSKLAEDLQGDPEQRDLLRGTDHHLMGVLDVGLLWDTRDHDLVPSSGAFHEASVRFTPDPRSDLSYAGATLAFRLYRSLYRDRLVLAARVMGDLLFGNAPVYELARHGGLFPMPAPGGGSGIRGVPMQRYHGKVKLLSNVELRARVLPLSLLGQRFNIGAIVFVDAGRVWSDLSARQRFDGSGPGIKVGTGGGLRIQWGEALLLRADVAWSPDADPIGFYFNVNHVF